MVIQDKLNIFCSSSLEWKYWEKTNVHVDVETWKSSVLYYWNTMLNKAQP